MTSQWLEGALTDAGHNPPPIAAVEVRPMDDFLGAMGEVVIVSATYAGDTDLPDEFVAKCPMDNEFARQNAAVMLSYQRENGFYDHLAAQVAARADITIPACFVNLFDPETHAATLVIERVHPADKGDILDGTTFERMHTLVGDLARMHGVYWMDETLNTHVWLIDWTAPSLLAGIPRTLESWSNIREQYPHFHSDELVAMVEVFLADIPSWLGRFARRPWTLIHQDYELDNVLFEADGPVIVDWQSPMRSFPGMDLGWLLMASHNDETLTREPELLDHYRRVLAESGGPQWGEQDLLEDLAWACLFWVSVSHLPFMATVQFGEEFRFHRRFKAMMEGTIAGAERWGAAERMRAHA
jgi:hypothetical protein